MALQVDFDLVADAGVHVVRPCQHQHAGLPSRAQRARISRLALRICRLNASSARPTCTARSTSAALTDDFLQRRVQLARTPGRVRPA